MEELFARLLGTGGGNYDEIQKLDALLTEAGIPHQFIPHIVGGYQLTYYGIRGKPEPDPGKIILPGVGAVCSAIQTPASYGHEKGLIEISGLLTAEERLSDTVAGDLTAEDVFNRIREHWLRENGGQ